MKLEVCVADPLSLAAAIAGGADRVELCSALELGGLTPGPGLIALAAAAPMPVYALVRPRAGDLVFAPPDIDAMLRDIDAVRAAGLAGIVIGASRPDGALDARLLERLVAHAAGLGVALHRAFDLVPDIEEAVETAVALGVERLLTSGGAPRALDGLAGIARTHAAARGRVAIMAGSGLRPDNVAQLLAAVPVDAVHGSCATAVPQAVAAVRLGIAAPTLRRTDAAVVRAFRTVLAAY